MLLPIPEEMYLSVKTTNFMIKFTRSAPPTASKIGKARFVGKPI